VEGVEARVEAEGCARADRCAERWSLPRALGHILATKLASRRDSRRFVFFVAKLNPTDLELLGAWAAEGKVKPVIDRTYSLEQVADAFRYLDEGHARGKIVVSFG
jgi:NADPH:quinone reductase-like Zn-dependent oxidoreductase